MWFIALFPRRAIGQDYFQGLRETIDPTIAFYRPVIGGIKQDREATGALPRRHIPPGIADHKGTASINPPFPGCPDQHPRFRLAAVAIITIIVQTDVNGIDLQPAADQVVHPLQFGSLQPPPGNVRLVGDHDPEIFGLLQIADETLNPGGKLELAQLFRGEGLAVFDCYPVDNSVPVQKYRLFHIDFRQDLQDLQDNILTRDCFEAKLDIPYGRR